MSSLRTPHQFKSQPSLILMGLIGLGLAYALASRAWDTGSLGQYFVTLLLLILSGRLIARAFKK